MEKGTNIASNSGGEAYFYHLSQELSAMKASQEQILIKQAVMSANQETLVNNSQDAKEAMREIMSEVKHLISVLNQEKEERVHQDNEIRSLLKNEITNTTEGYKKRIDTLKSEIDKKIEILTLWLLRSLGIFALSVIMFIAKNLKSFLNV